MAPKRRIFQNIGTDKPAMPNEAVTQKIKPDPKAIRAWLMTLFILVCLIIIVGGLTRLTDSGLSITEWQPIMGAVPPVSELDWLRAFSKYQETSEFKYQNNAMTLAQFKSIFWWEWGHRQLGRVIGLVWAFGFLWFWAKGQINAQWAKKLLLLGGIGALQGAVGWLMVKSGLIENRIDVAPYMLAIHLGLAFGILGMIFWYISQLKRGFSELLQSRRSRVKEPLRWSGVIVFLTALQIILGALVSGLDAGNGHTDWPLMLGRFFPEGAFSLTPWGMNFFENPALAQFDHRMLAYTLTLIIGIAWFRMGRSGQKAMARCFHFAFAAVVLQMIIGIVMLTHSMPWSLAIAHQFGAILLWVAVVRARFFAAFPLVSGLQK